MTGVDLADGAADGWRLLADGKVVTTKAFPGPAAGCPWFSMIDKDHPEVAVRVEKKQIEDWLETLATP